jgi:hypothetical protein
MSITKMAYEMTIVCVIWSGVQQARMCATHSLFSEKKSSGGHHGKAGAMNHNSKTVVGMNLSTGEVRTFGSAAEAARELGIGSGSVPRCCSGMYKHSAGWSFRYAD